MRWALAALVMLSLAWSAGCSRDGNRSYDHQFRRFDKYSTVLLDVETTPASARVYAKAAYDVEAKLRAGSDSRTDRIDDGNITHDLKDWTLIGTSPVRDFLVLQSGTSTDRGFRSAASVTLTLRQFSLRIEKEGYETLEVPQITLRPKATKLHFELVPTQTPGPTTQP